MLSFAGDAPLPLRARRREGRLLPQHLLQDLRARPAGRLDPRPARGAGKARDGERGQHPLPERLRAGRGHAVPVDDAVARADQGRTARSIASAATRCSAPCTISTPAGTSWTRPTGGLFVWATLPEGLDSKAMMPRAIAARVAYVPGTGFYADGTGTSNMRLNFSYATPERIREGVRRLCRRDGAGAGDARRLRCGFRAAPPPTPGRGRCRRSRPRLGMITGMGTGDEVRVMVLAGGLSYERDVSLRSGRRVLDALKSQGVTAEMHDADVSLLPALQEDPPDAVVIALHGATGEDGSLRGVLDLCGIPYVGCDARASRLAWDKPSAKSMLREAGIPTPDWVALPHDRFSELGAVAVLDRIVDRLGLATDGQARPGRVRSRRRGGSGSSRPAAGHGRLLRVRLDRAGRAVRARQGRGGFDRRPGRRTGGPTHRGDRPARRCVRLCRPLHGRPDHVARAGTPRRRGGGTRRRDGAGRAQGARACAISPGST